MISTTATNIPEVTYIGGASVAERWAGYIMTTMRAGTDPKTIGIWTRLLGVSRSSLCECCRLIHVSPHDARDFGRLMRVIHCSSSKWEPEAFLDLADIRTLNKLLLRAGLKKGGIETPPVFEFLDRQQWIPKANPGLVRLRELLLESDLRGPYEHTHPRTDDPRMVRRASVERPGATERQSSACARL
jgi:hypothetical protein